MIEKLRPYREYKDSGVSSLGAIPQHWKMRRSRHVAHILVSNIDKNSIEGELPVRLCNYVDVYKNERITSAVQFMRATATADEIERFRLRPGDVIITKDSESWDDIGVPSLVEYGAPDLVCGYHLAILRPRPEIVSGAYLLRALQSLGVAVQYHVFATGVIRYGLSHHTIKSVLLPVPPPAEQEAIARFLGYVDRRVRRFSAAKKKLIALLNEQKQAIIHRAVTRGLDPNVRLKPSGLPWLGDVPLHWEIKKIRHCGAIVGGMTPSMAEPSYWDGDIPWVTPKDMKRTLISGSQLHVTEAAVSETGLRILPPGVVLLVVRGMILARKVPIAATTAAVTINQDMKAIIPKPEFDARFLVYAMDSAQSAFSPLIDEAGHGTKRLPTERWRELAFGLPALPEQMTIINHVEKATADLNMAIENIAIEISRLAEYLTRLIADVVTGKVDVREVAAGLPEEPAEAEPIEEIEPPDEAEELESETGAKEAEA